jgi:hypothetical protein
MKRAKTVRETGTAVLHEEGLLDRADVYRDMANKARTPTLRDEFNERAERYETVASVLRRRRMRPEPSE